MNINYNDQEIDRWRFTTTWFIISFGTGETVHWAGVLTFALQYACVEPREICLRQCHVAKRRTAVLSSSQSMQRPGRTDAYLLHAGTWGLQPRGGVGRAFCQLAPMEAGGIVNVGGQVSRASRWQTCPFLRRLAPKQRVSRLNIYTVGKMGYLDPGPISDSRVPLELSATSPTLGR